MNFFKEAIENSRSTILYGSFGRYPHLVQFYLEAFPELEYASEYELVFWHRRRRLLYVLLEPPFDTVLPPDRWYLVLTSHPRLLYNPLTTRLIGTDPLLQREIPLPRNAAPHQTPLLPPTSHIVPFFNRKASRIDLSDTQSSHEAYLRLLTWYDVLLPSTEWSLSLPEKLRHVLLKDLPGTGLYDAHLRKILG